MMMKIWNRHTSYGPSRSALGVLGIALVMGAPLAAVAGGTHDSEVVDVLYQLDQAIPGRCLHGG